MWWFVNSLFSVQKPQSRNIVSSLRRLFLPCVAFSLLAAVATAEPAQKRGDPSPSPRSERGLDKRGGGDRLAEMSNKLGLTPDQKNKVAAILKEEADKAKALREDTALSKEQKAPQMKAIREGAQSSIKAVLTPEQLAKFDHDRKEGPRPKKK
jgi:Spy/CpxP family protein refolding chaperone